MDNQERILNFALAGNPNVGKTSVYNRITHSLEHVGNWHGVTVKEKVKQIMFDHRKINMIDLPGLYSLSVYSFEESISRDSVLNGNNDLIINICEVNNLARNLYLTLQLLELNVPVVLVINMMDELKKQGKVLNYRKLEKVLKIPIVPMSARYHSDVHLLMEVALDYAQTHSENKVDLDYLNLLPLEDVETIIGAKASEANIPIRYAAIKILENDEYIFERLNLTDDQKKALSLLGDWQPRVASARYGFIEKITEGAISKSVVSEHKEMHMHLIHSVPVEGGISGAVEASSEKYTPLSKEEEKKNKKFLRQHNKILQREKLNKNGFSIIDKVVLNKYLALPIFLMLMATIFVITFGLLGKLFSDLLDLGIEKLIYEPLTNWFISINCPIWINKLIGEGIILGVGGILTFLPQIVLLFFFLALLEDSGYISRVAFMTDGIFRKIGLSGRSAFTMLMGFGCSATAVLTARGLEDKMMRKKTVLLTPFMSCSARLPVYSTIAAAFFAGGQPFIIFGLYILGVAVALGFAAIFEKCIKPLKSGKLSFIMEMPPYRLPTFERVFQLIWNNAKVFLIRVGTVVFALNVIVWILSNFSFTTGFTTGTDNKSILEIISSFIAPIFAPNGFNNWRAVTALMSGLVAKEVVISSIESLGGIGNIFVGQFAAASAFSFLVFTLLYIPCIATISAMSKEVGAKWTVFNAVLQILTAYVFSVLAYWTGVLFTVNLGLAVGIVSIIIVALVLFGVITHIIKNRGKCGYACADCSKNCSKKK